MHSFLVGMLIALQVFVVAFIALHDWVRLGVLNDVLCGASRRQPDQTDHRHGPKRASLCDRPRGHGLLREDPVSELVELVSLDQLQRGHLRD